MRRSRIDLKAIQKFLLFCAFAALFIIRIFVVFSWISSLALAGLFLAILDILSHVWDDNPRNKIKHPILYIFSILFIVLIEIILIVLTILNIATPIPWLSDALFTDLLTIFVLFLGVFQPTIIKLINFGIQGIK